MNINLSYDARKETAYAIRNKLDSLNSKLYVWGCSLTAKTVIEYLKKVCSAVPYAFIVDDKYYDSPQYISLPVIKRSEYEKSCVRNDQIVIGFTNEKAAEALKKQLPKEIDCYYFFFTYSASSENRWLDADFYKKHSARFEKTFNSLADEKSKTVMQAFINACISGDISELNKHISSGQYFNELTIDKCKGDFIDLGAYIGDTAIKALDFYGSSIGNVISFEPDNENIKKYINAINIHKEYLDRYKLIKKGSWSKKDTLYFSSSDSSSSVSDTGNISIEVDSVDNVLEEIGNSTIGYIKMDVEGSEKETLLGCKKTIQKHHPSLAVCVYHKPEDLFELFDIISEYDTENKYKYYLRYYGPDLRELVLYAL